MTYENEKQAIQTPPLEKVQEFWGKTVVLLVANREPLTANGYPVDSAIQTATTALQSVASQERAVRLFTPTPQSITRTPPKHYL
jgi:hypothetical protein